MGFKRIVMYSVLLAAFSCIDAYSTDEPKHLQVPDEWKRICESCGKLKETLGGIVLFALTKFCGWEASVDMSSMYASQNSWQNLPEWRDLKIVTLKYTPDMSEVNSSQDSGITTVLKSLLSPPSRPTQTPSDVVGLTENELRLPFLKQVESTPAASGKQGAVFGKDFVAGMDKLAEAMGCYTTTARSRATSSRDVASKVSLSSTAGYTVTEAPERDTLKFSKTATTSENAPWIRMTKCTCNVRQKRTSSSATTDTQTPSDEEGKRSKVTGSTSSEVPSSPSDPTTTLSSTAPTEESKTYSRIPGTGAEGDGTSSPSTTTSPSVNAERTTSGPGFCRSRAKMGLEWPDTVAGGTAEADCPGNTTGVIRWFCNNNTLEFEPENPIAACTPLCPNKTKYVEYPEFKRGPWPKHDSKKRRPMRSSATCENVSEEDMDNIIRNVSMMRKKMHENRLKGIRQPPGHEDRMKKFVENAVGTFSTYVDDSVARREHQRKRKVTALKMISCVEDIGWLATYHRESHDSKRTTKVEAENIVLKSFALNETSNYLDFRIQDEAVGCVLLPGKSLLEKAGNPCKSTLAFGVAMAFKGIEKLVADDEESSAGFQLNSEVLGVSLTECSKSYTLPKGTKARVELKHVDGTLPGIPKCVFLLVGNATRGKYGQWDTKGCRITEHTLLQTVCECDHLTNFAILMDMSGSVFSPIEERVLNVMSVVLCSASVVALALTIITFTSVKNLRTKRNIITCNLAVCLLLINILVQTALKRYNTMVCQVMSCALQFLVLSAFMWMLMEAVLLYRLVIMVFEVKELELVWLYPVSYGVPFLIILSTSLPNSKFIIRDRYCWPSYEDGYAWTVGGPIAVVLTINFCVFLLTLRAAGKLEKANIYSGGNLKKKKENLKTRVKGAVSLTCVLGLTWLSGFLVQPGFTAAAFIFVFLNGLQGVFLFITQVLLCRHVRPVAISFYKQGMEKISNVTSTLRTELKIKRGNIIYPQRNATGCETSIITGKGEMRININIESCTSISSDESRNIPLGEFSCESLVHRMAADKGMIPVEMPNIEKVHCSE